MALQRLLHREAGLLQQLLGQGGDLLAMLQRAGAVIGHGDAGRGPAGGIAEFVQRLGNIHRHGGDACGGGGFRRLAEHEAVILHRGAAARGIDHHRIQPRRIPGQDIGPRCGHGGVMQAHMMGQRAAAAGGWRHHHLHPHAGEKADGGGVDFRVQHLLGAAGQQRHAAAPRALGGVEAAERLRGWQGFWCQFQHGAQPFGRHRLAGDQAGEATHQPGQAHGGAEARGIGQDHRQHAAQQALRQGAVIGLLDMPAGMIDEVHVVHPGGAGCHAAQAGEAAINMAGLQLGGGAAILQHVLDEVDAAAR